MPKLGYEHKISWTDNLTRTKTSQLLPNFTHCCTWTWTIFGQVKFASTDAAVLLPHWFRIIPLQYHLYNICNDPIQRLCQQPSSPKHSGVAAAFAAPHSPCYIRGESATTAMVSWLSYLSNDAVALSPQKESEGGHVCKKKWAYAPARRGQACVMLGEHLAGDRRHVGHFFTPGRWSLS